MLKLNFLIYLFQYTFSSINYVFFNLYLLKASSKLTFWGLIEYQFILDFFEY